MRDSRASVLVIHAMFLFLFVAILATAAKGEEQEGDEQLRQRQGRREGAGNLKLVSTLLRSLRLQCPIVVDPYPVVSKDGGAAQVQFQRYVLLRWKDDLIALMLQPNPRRGSSGVTYVWFRLSDGTDRFFLPPTDKYSLAAPNPAIDSASGESIEPLEDGMDGPYGRIQIGRLNLRWSAANLNSAWIYSSGEDAELKIYSSQFERMEDFSGKLSSRKWTPLRKKE